MPRNLPRIPLYLKEVIPATGQKIYHPVMRGIVLDESYTTADEAQKRALEDVRRRHQMRILDQAMAEVARLLAQQDEEPGYASGVLSEAFKQNTTEKLTARMDELKQEYGILRKEDQELAEILQKLSAGGENDTQS